MAAIPAPAAVSPSSTRKRKCDPEYLEHNITSKSQLYTLYCEWLASNHPGEQPLTEHYYQDCFNEFFDHVKLTRPKVDTCKDCDNFKKSIEDPRTEAPLRMQYENKLKEHHLKAQRAFDLPAEILGQTDGDTAVICIDLQAALLTLKVTAGMTYYKRKLSTLNIVIHDYRTGRGHMFVWDEEEISTALTSHKG